MWDSDQFQRLYGPESLSDVICKKKHNQKDAVGIHQFVQRMIHLIFLYVQISNLSVDL